MKITFLSFYSGHLQRGAENFVHELASHLGTSHEVTLIQSGPNNRGGTRYKVKTIPFEINWQEKDQRMYAARRFFVDYWSRKVAKFTWQALKIISPSDIVIPVDSGWESFLVRLWAYKNNSKMVITGHSGMGWDDRVNLLCRPDTFVTLSNFQLAWANKNGFGVPVVKIPNGIDLETFSPKIKPAKLNLPKPVIICVAALEENKRIDLLIKAVAKLKEGSLLLLGDGPDKKKLLSLGDNLLPGRLKQLKVSYEKIPSYYRAADVFTLPTVPREPFGLVYLEAMACGIPVVAPSDPIRREIVGEGGLLVDLENPVLYAEALDAAIKKSWNGSPRSQAQKYSWDRVVKEYEALFYSLAPGK